MISMIENPYSSPIQKRISLSSILPNVNGTSYANERMKLKKKMRDILNFKIHEYDMHKD